MNKVYMSGVIHDAPAFVQEEGKAPHLSFLLRVAHKSKNGMKQELYRVNAWNGVAVWGGENLKHGQHLALAGYLSQRQLRVASASWTAVEITAEEFFKTEQKEQMTEKEELNEENREIGTNQEELC